MLDVHVDTVHITVREDHFKTVRLVLSSKFFIILGNTHGRGID